ncbi:hypothetical protein HK405_006047, partial [Cladochytrium tenue]
HLIDKYDAWIRSNKKKLFASEAQLFEELDKNADFGTDMGVEGPEENVLTEDEALSNLVEMKGPAPCSVGMRQGAVNPSSMVNILTDLSTGLRHMLQYFVIALLQICYEDALDACDVVQLQLIGNELQAKKIQLSLEPVAEFVCKCTKEDGLSREAIVKLIPVKDVLCFQWALIYGVLLLSAMVHSEVLKGLT